MGLPDGGGVEIATAGDIDVDLNPQSPEVFDLGKNEKLTNGGDCGDEEDTEKKADLDDDCDNGDDGVGEIEKREIDLEEEKEKEDGEGLRSDGNGGDVEQTMVFPPNPQLPKPEAPPGVVIRESEEESEKTETMIPSIKRSNSTPESVSDSVQIPAIGKFFREKSNSLSAAFTRKLSLLTENNDVVSEKQKSSNVTEFNLSGLKVTVKLKNEKNEEIEQFKGRITFFSRSNCRDSTAVRSFFRDRKLRYVEINIDVYPTREKELIDRTGSNAVPQIFFNEKLFGGLVALNSLRNCGLLDERMKELLCRKCPDDAPAPPVYGFDDPEEEKADEMITAVRILRQKLPIQDRLMKMKIVKNCFSSSEMVEVLIHQFDCGRKKAVEIGKQIARRHFIHHVFGENEFEDGNHFYRFLEHEPFIPKCYNFRGTNDLEPKSASAISLKLTKIMSAMLESYTSEDGCHLDYLGISNSEEFRRYVNLLQELQRVDITTLSASERLAFFLNLHNAMVIHAVISIGHPGGAVIDRRSFNSDFIYVIGGYPYSLTTIVNGVLRNNRRPPYSFTKPFGSSDKRLELAFPQVNPLIHFGMCNGSKSSPPVRFFTPQAIESELRFSAREFLQKDGIQVDLAKRTVHLTRIFKWYSVDFGQEKEILRWIIGFLDATKAGLLSHLLGDGGAVHIVYQNYDWSLNC